MAPRSRNNLILLACIYVLMGSTYVTGQMCPGRTVLRSTFAVCDMNDMPCETTERMGTFLRVGDIAGTCDIVVNNDDIISTGLANGAFCVAEVFFCVQEAVDLNLNIRRNFRRRGRNRDRSRGRSRERSRGRSRERSRGRSRSRSSSSGGSS